MTRKEIIKLARDAGLSVESANIGDGIMIGLSPPLALERFVEIIKEECAKEAEKTVTMEGYEKEIAFDIRKL